MHYDVPEPGDSCLFAMEKLHMKCVVVFIRNSLLTGEEDRENLDVSSTVKPIMRGLLPDDDVFEVRHVTPSHISA